MKSLMEAVYKMPNIVSTGIALWNLRCKTVGSMERLIMVQKRRQLGFRA